MGTLVEEFAQLQLLVDVLTRTGNAVEVVVDLFYVRVIGAFFDCIYHAAASGQKACTKSQKRCARQNLSHVCPF